MEADNESIKNWLNDISRGVLQLPRFQRGEVWNHNHVKDFLNAVISYDRPVGILLTLKVDSENPPFITRLMGGADSDNRNCRVHLLDGQQRLTALWKALNDKYDDRLYFIKFELNGGQYVCKSVECVIRRNNSWVENPSEVLNKNYIPIRLLYPEKAIDEIESWFENVEGYKHDELISLRKFALKLWEQLSNKKIPYWSLPQSTSPDDAIEIFINTNTSFVKLTPYNIAVAQFEADTKESLQEMVDKIGKEIPRILNLEGKDSLGDLVLKVACLIQGKMPTYSNYKSLDMKLLKCQYNKIRDGIEWATEVINKERIWKETQLPTSVPLRVLPALFQYMPKHGDDRAKADRLISRYIWRSFFTSRYDRQANSRLNLDYNELRRALENKVYKCSGEKTIFSEELPTEQDLLSEGWPKSKGIRKRAILAVSNREGARDIASNVEIFPDYDRQYHHIFPRGLFSRLKETRCNPELALNCMLIEELSNQKWKDRWPGDYILERIKNSGLNGTKAKEELRHRLESHLLPTNSITDAVEARNKDLYKIYQDFLKKRAKLIVEKMKELCEI